MVVNGDTWWFMVINGDSCWLIVANATWSPLEIALSWFIRFMVVIGTVR